MRRRLIDGGDAPVPADQAIPLFDAVLDGVDGPVGVAVSGGPDSTALLHLADAWARRRRRELVVLTVDHRLRPGSGSEAATVAALSNRLGWPHQTLTWVGSKPSSGLPDAARVARRRLLTDACRAAGAVGILFAHHRDDQVETVVHRLARHSGPLGLAGIATRSRHEGVLLVRPLLAIPKARLVATCHAAGLPVMVDPTNHDQRFARARVRAAQHRLDTVGLTAERVLRLANAMRSLRTAIDGEVDAWLDRHAVVTPSVLVQIDRAAFQAVSPTLGKYVLRRALTLTTGSAYPPRGGSLEAALDWIRSASSRSTRTLAGCVMIADDAALSVCREVAACAPALDVPARSTGCWDGRFLVTNSTDRPVRVQACGATGWRRLRLTGAETARPAAVCNVMHRARLASPAVLDLDGAMAVPHLVNDAGGLSTILHGDVYLQVVSTVRDRFGAECAAARP